jgi:cobalt-zinc-cadmium efflux system outer membrane protein
MWVGFEKEGVAENLDYYLEEASRDNLSLQATYQEYEAFLEKVNQEGYLPDPMVSVGVFVQPVETKVGPQRGKIGIQQMVPWFGTISQKKSFAANQAKLKHQEYLVVQNDLFLQLKSIWYPMLALNQKIEVMEDNHQILESYYRLSTQRLESGKGNMVDVIRIDMKKEALDIDLNLAREELTLMGSQFNLLCNAEENRKLDLPTKAEQQVLFETAFTHPKLEYFSLWLDGLTIKKDLAQKQFMPSFGFGLDYVFVGQSDMDVVDSGKDAIMPMISVKVPIYRRKYKSKLAELEHIEQSVLFSKQAFEQKLESTILSVKYEEERFEQLWKLYQEQTQKLEQSIEILLISYSNSGKDFESLLEMQQKLLGYQLAELEIQKEHQLALARKEAIMGREYAK